MGATHPSYETPPPRVRVSNASPNLGRATRKRGYSERAPKTTSQALSPSRRSRRSIKSETFPSFSPKDQKVTRKSQTDVDDLPVYRVSLDVEASSGSSADSVSPLTSEVYELPRKSKLDRQSFSNKTAAPREPPSMSPLIPSTLPPPLIHWQLLVPRHISYRRRHVGLAQ